MPRRKSMPARSKSRAKANGNTSTSSHDTGEMAKLTEFPNFRCLPAELRMSIVEEALSEYDQGRRSLVVVFEDNTRRISPTSDLAQDLCPLLYVNRQFRSIALKTYFKIRIVEHGPPTFNQYGPSDDWYNENEELQYNVDIARQIDEEARKAAENGDFRGCLYVNPKKDIFIIGSVPIHIAQTMSFNDMASQVADDKEHEGSKTFWDVTHFYVTEPLANSICAKIYEMRELVWDPITVCSICDGYHPPCCPPCFYDGRGDELSPKYKPDTFPNVGKYGYYVMGGALGPEAFLLAITHLGSKGFLKDRKWNWRYFHHQRNFRSRD